MPFEKGNQWAKLKRGTKSRKVMEWEYMGMKVMGEATTGYTDLMEKLFAGIQLSEPEKEAMNRYEKILEHFKPKLSRAEVEKKVDKNITIKWEE